MPLRSGTKKQGRISTFTLRERSGTSPSSRTPFSCALRTSGCAVPVIRVWARWKTTHWLLGIIAIVGPRAPAFRSIYATATHRPLGLGARSSILGLGGTSCTRAFSCTSWAALSSPAGRTTTGPRGRPVPSQMPSTPDRGLGRYWSTMRLVIASFFSSFAPPMRTYTRLRCQLREDPGTHSTSPRQPHDIASSEEVSFTLLGGRTGLRRPRISLSPRTECSNSP